jgi:hypothetical protein
MNHTSGPAFRPTEPFVSSTCPSVLHTSVRTSVHLACLACFVRRAWYEARDAGGGSEMESGSLCMRKRGEPPRSVSLAVR